MSTWHGIQGALLQTQGTFMAWWAERTRNEPLRQRGTQLVVDGALLRRGPATREVDRRLRVIMTRAQTVKNLRAGLARP
jgi:hypothetical protein